jgi:hypothetical protein
MSAITGAFANPFGLSGELGLGTASLLGANASGTPNASAILTADTTQTGPLAAIAAARNVAQTPTIAALETGALTTSQHTVIQALAASAKPISVPWNTDGTEPTTLAQERSYGWIKLVEPTYNPTTRFVTSATYELTPVGKAIAARTGGDGVTANGISITA